MPDDDPLSATLAAIRERERKATKGPWKLRGRDPLVETAEVAAEGYVGARLPSVIASLYMSVGKHEREVANADFIAHARTDVPLLLAAIEAVLKKADDWEGTRVERLVTRGYAAECFRAAITRELTGKEAGDA